VNLIFFSVANSSTRLFQAYSCGGNCNTCVSQEKRTVWRPGPVVELGVYPKSAEQDAAHEPECSHIEHYCETSYLNNLVHYSLLPYQCTVDCGMWKRVECKVCSVECRVWSVQSKLWSVVEGKVWSVRCGVYSVECKVWSVKCGV